MKTTTTAAHQWFRDAKFGLFIHYGPYAASRRSSETHAERVPKREYERFAGRLCLQKGYPEGWVRLAKAAGMKYAVLTTKHHDGFCLFDTATTRYKAPCTPIGRDVVREFAEACRRQGLRVGFYYSPLEFHHPGYVVGPRRNPKLWREFLDHVRAQLRELCTNYGRVDVIWFDGGPGCWEQKDWDFDDLEAMIRQLQPGILINDRGSGHGDFVTPEQALTVPSDLDQLWESCMTVGSNVSWGYNEGDDLWKTTKQLLMNLATCAHNDGNFLLNIGPMPDGTVPAPCVRRLREIGRWLARNGASIFGTRGRPFMYRDQRITTYRERTAYFHVFYWHGREYCLGGIGNKVLSARILTTGQKLRVRQRGDRCFLSGLPAKMPDCNDTVLALELDGPPRYAEFKDGSGRNIDRQFKSKRKTGRHA